MRRWEHLVVPVGPEYDSDPESLREVLDHYGNEGWELVSFEFRPLLGVKGGIGASNLLFSAGA